MLAHPLLVIFLDLLVLPQHSSLMDRANRTHSTVLLLLAKPYITTGTLANILDKKLEDIKGKKNVEAVANIALQCVAYRSTERPFFQKVLQVLEAALQVELPQQALLPLAADVSIDPPTGVHTVIPIIGGSNNRDESIVHVAPHKTI